jgi:Zn-finger nucleic acid-binding protein
MVGTKAGDFEVMGCDTCAGMFIPHETFEMMQDTSNRQIETTAITPRQPVAKLEETVSYVRCPVCRQMMNRQNFARISGVIIDTCGKHGVWFDAGELESIMDFLARGGLQKARERELEHQKLEQKLATARQESHGVSPMGFDDLDIGPLGALGRKGSIGLSGYPIGVGPDLVEIIGGIWSLFKR